MSRSTVCCSEAHTPQSPNKNRIRRDWLLPLNKSKDLITISHGALEAMMMCGWKGRIFVCDIDPGVIESTKYMSESEYRDLKIKAILSRIEVMVTNYCFVNGAKNLAAVDVDLADCLDTCWPILAPVLDALVTYRAKGTKVFFTFRNGRDCFGRNGIDKRIQWLKSRLPEGVRLNSHTTYNSTRITQFAERRKGSPMCIVEMQVA
jgi:hypothetical protein